MALAVLAGRGADFFDKEVDEASAGGITDFFSNLGNRLVCGEKESLGVFDAGVDHILQRSKAGFPFEHVGKIIRAEPGDF